MGLLRIGDPMDKNTDVGAINSAEQLERIETLVAAGEDEGAHRRTVPCELPERGYWFAADAVDRRRAGHNRVAVGRDLRPRSSRCSASATQGEAIEKANNSRYGLAGRDLDRQGSQGVRGSKARCALASVWQNTYNHFDPTAAFGGYKESGFGPRGAPGPGLRPYLRVVRWTERLVVRKTYKLWIGGAFVPLGIRAL